MIYVPCFLLITFAFLHSLLKTATIINILSLKWKYVQSQIHLHYIIYCFFKCHRTEIGWPGIQCIICQHICDICLINASLCFSVNIKISKVCKQNINQKQILSPNSLLPKTFIFNLLLETLILHWLPHLNLFYIRTCFQYHLLHLHSSTDM